MLMKVAQTRAGRRVGRLCQKHTILVVVAVVDDRCCYAQRRTGDKQLQLAFCATAERRRNLRPELH